MRTLFAVLALTGVLAGGSAASTNAPANAYCYIGWPNDGQVLAAGKPFRVWFGLRHMGVAPKGVRFANTGHHHLLIDTELPPGKHTLQLLMGDENHVPHTPPVTSKRITVTVK